MKTPVDISTAIGAARSFIYAMSVCNGYNPCDEVFWNLVKSGPPGDKAWNIVSPDIIARYGNTIDVPTHMVEQSNEPIL